MVSVGLERKGAETLGGEWGIRKPKRKEREAKEGGKHTIRLPDKQPFHAREQRFIHPEVSQELTDLLLATRAHVRRYTGRSIIPYPLFTQVAKIYILRQI